MACTLSYPAANEDADLLRIHALKERYPDIIVGLVRPYGAGRTHGYTLPWAWLWVRRLSRNTTPWIGA